MRPNLATSAEQVTVAEDFAQLFSTSFARMVRLAALLGADDPEDIAQEAFARFDERRNRLPRDINASAYLRKTVVNLTRSRLRHLRVTRRFTPDVPHVESAEILAVLSEDRQRVIKGLSRLSQRQRQVLVLRYWMDLSEREIAETLDIRPGTVKSTASQALAALGREIGDDSA
jgi:RNA polymerase sigma-70 factor (sigma-E family)